jgi:hypothetical protein
MIPREMIPYVDLVALDPSGEAYHARVMGHAWPRLWAWLACSHDDLLDASIVERGIMPHEPVRLDADLTRRLGDALASDLSTGDIDEAIRAMLDHYASLDLVECDPCDGTGIRADQIGVMLGLPDVDLDETTSIAVGRDRGTCDVCSGFGRHEHPETRFTFERETVEMFSMFLRTCGGMVIL